MHAVECNRMRVDKYGIAWVCSPKHLDGDVRTSDIHWVQLPAANGHEQRGRRPAVILQDDHYAGGLPVVLVVPLTTARATMRFAGTVLIQPTAENGLPQVSVALVFQLLAIDRRRVQERIGNVGATVLHEMLAELDKLTGRTP